MEKRQNTKKIIFSKLWKKPEILMVLTLQFDKNLLKYITLNLQRLFRTVLVWHFKKNIFFNFFFFQKKLFFSKTTVNPLIKFIPYGATRPYLARFIGSSK